MNESHYAWTRLEGINTRILFRRNTHTITFMSKHGQDEELKNRGSRRNNTLIFPDQKQATNEETNG